MAAKIDRKTPTDVNFKLNINQETGTSNSDDLNDSYLGLNIIDQIGTPMNFERTDFNFNFNQLTFDVFFHQADTLGNREALVKFNDVNWDTYFTQLLGKLNNQENPGVSNKLITDRDALNQVASVQGIRNNIIELNTLEPTFFGVPSFYNSFTYLYVENAEQLKYQFDTQAFFYNSFIKIDFYTNNNFYKQHKMFSKIVYNNKRYLDKEYGYGTNTQPKSTFIMDETVDGYVVNWSINTPITNLYARFSYYDAFSGRTIQLLPSTKNSSEELKWVQNPQTLLPQQLYLKYELNTNSQTYLIKTFDSLLNEYTTITDKFDLFELIVDEFWAKDNGYVKVDRVFTEPVVIITNEPDSFEFETDSLIMHTTYKGSDEEFNKNNGGFVNGPEPKRLNTTIINKLNNTGESTLKLKEITIESVGDLNITGGYKPSITTQETNISHWTEQPIKLIKSFRMFLNPTMDFRTTPFFHIDNKERLKITNNGNGYDYSDIINLSTSYRDGRYRETCVPSITLNDTAQPSVLRQIPITLNVTYGAQHNGEVKPGASVDLEISVDVGNSFIRGSQANIFKNLLLYDDLLVTVYMLDQIGNEIISKTFKIDFRLLSLRFTGLDYDEYGVINVNKYDQYGNVVGTEEEDIQHFVKFDGVSTTKANINNYLTDKLINNYNGD